MSNARLEELRRKFQENPRRYFAPFANELRKAGDSPQAIEICRAHLSSQPGHVSGHIVLAQALHEAGELDEARQVFTTALELDPENLIALRSMGEIAYANGEFGDARRLYERLLDADPRNAEVAQLIADLSDEPVVDVVAAAPPAIQQPFAPTAPPVLSFAGPDEVDSPVESETLVENPMEFLGPTEEYAGVRPPEPAAPDEPIDLDVMVSEDHGIGDLASALDMADDRADDVHEPVSHAEAELLEIEDMDSFLSPTSTPVVGADAEPEVAPMAEQEFSTEAFGSAEVLPGDASDRWSGEPVDEPDMAGARLEDESSEQETGDSEPRASDWSDAAVLESDAAAAPTMSSDTADRDPEAPPELPHALFAENGFEGTAASTDATGWMTPQGYAEASDPAAAADWMEDAPENEGAPAMDAGTPADADVGPDRRVEDDWFAMESAAPTAAPAPTREQGDEWFPTEPVSTGTPPSGEDWFDAPSEPEPAASPTGSREELYLAPELIPVSNGGEESLDGEIAEIAETAAVAEAEEPVEASAPDDVVVEASATDDVVVEANASDETPPEAFPPVPPAMAVDLPHANLGHTPRFSAAMAPDTSSTPPFVTETLAELYIQQGFHNEALSIYRQLAERDPQDDSIRRRIEALEVGETAKAVQPAEVPDEAGEERSVKSQSVRSFFSGFARRTPSAAAVEARLARSAGETGQDRPDAAGDPAGGHGESSFAAAASALATLFAASQPGATDEGAASKLAGAWTEPAPGGRPSRTADRELSLDHLFRDVPASGTGGVMLDQFYAQPVDSSGQAARPDEGAGTPDEGEADIRQFTAWLEGLRKK